MLTITLWIAMVVLYLGLAGALGSLLSLLVNRRGSGQHALAGGYAGTLFVAGSSLVLGFDEWLTAARLAILAAGVGVSILAYRKPAWIPEPLLRRAFGQQYLAGAMAFAALWALNQAFSSPSPAPMMIALSAIAAGAASYGTAIGAQSERSTYS